jgi:hypothetical protein
MKKVDISIWGIRAGFEENGIFHSHNLEDVKLLQKDRLRSLADFMRPRNFFILNRTNQHSIVTLIYTDIFESAVSGNPRSGHVGFSLIFPKNHALVDSPRKFLLDFAKWYKHIQGNSRVNNFTSNQISEILNNLILKEINIKDRHGDMVVAINSENELDDFLTGGNKYAAFKELIIIDSNINFSQTGLTNQMISIEKSKEIIDNEEHKEFERKEAQRKLLSQINEAEREIQELKQLGRIDELINKYEKFPYKDEFSNAVKNIVQTEKQKIALKNLNQEDQRRAETIRKLIASNDLDDALTYLSKLKDTNRLSQKERSILELHELNVNQKKRIREKEKENKKKRDNRKKIFIISGIGVLLISLVTLSYTLKFPEFLFEEPQIASNETGNKNDTVNTEKKIVLDTLEIYKKQKDSLLNGDQITLYNDLEGNEILKKDVKVKFLKEKNKWKYLNGTEFIEVKKTESISELIKMFKIDTTALVPKNEKSSTINVSAETKQTTQTGGNKVLNSNNENNSESLSNDANKKICSDIYNKYKVKQSISQEEKDSFIKDKDKFDIAYKKISKESIKSTERGWEAKMLHLKGTIK